VVKGTETNSRTYTNTPKKLKNSITFVGKKKLFFKCDKTRPHTNAVTSVVIRGIGFNAVPHLRYSLDLFLPDLRLFVGLKKYLTEFVSHVIKKLRGFEEQPEECYSHELEKLVQC
jgi:hypothetical protein